MFDLSLSPSQVELLVRPGTLTTQAINITNNDSRPITLIPSLERWQASGSDGSVSYVTDMVKTTPDLLTFSLMNSDRLLNQPFTIAPYSQQQLVVKLKAAPDQIGDQYQTLFLTQVNTFSPDQTAATATGKIGVHFLVSVSAADQISYKGAITEFYAAPFFKDTFFTPIILHALVDNQSDYYFKTLGHLVIAKGNKTVSDITLEPTNVAARHPRSLAYTLNPPFWPGVYTANLTLDPATHTPVQTAYFFVFPFSLTALILILAAILFIFKKRHHPPVITAPTS